MASDGIPAGIPATVSSSTAAVVRDSGAAVADKAGSTGGKSLPPTGRAAGADRAAGSAGSAGEADSATSTRSSAQAAAQADGKTPQKDATTTNKATLQSLVVQLNKYLNDSGRPSQYRVEPGSGDSVIQEVNPANGAVIGEYSVSEFPALARGLGISGVLVNSHA